MIRALNPLGFPRCLVVADSLYGEGRALLEPLLELACIVAMWADHRVVLGPGQRVRDTGWKAFDRKGLPQVDAPNYSHLIRWEKTSQLKIFSSAKRQERINKQDGSLERFCAT
jgi:SRSO17 transposase